MPNLMGCLRDEASTLELEHGVHHAFHHGTIAIGKAAKLHAEHRPVVLGPGRPRALLRGARSASRPADACQDLLERELKGTGDALEDVGTAIGKQADCTDRLFLPRL